MIYDETQEAREREDRALERGDSPLIWLAPLNRCLECGCVPQETETGRWICGCDLLGRRQ